MTAVDLDALDKLRGALAAIWTEGGHDAADAVLPVVVQWANERAAAELRVAADECDRAEPGIADWLRARADALDPT